jgi:hypothetical protein
MKERSKQRKKKNEWAEKEIREGIRKSSGSIGQTTFHLENMPSSFRAQPHLRSCFARLALSWLAQ